MSKHCKRHPAPSICVGRNYVCVCPTSEEGLTCLCKGNITTQQQEAQRQAVHIKLRLSRWAGQVLVTRALIGIPESAAPIRTLIRQEVWCGVKCSGSSQSFMETVLCDSLYKRT